MKHSLIIIFFVFNSLAAAQDSSEVYDQKLNLLRLELGIGLEPLFNDSAYKLLIRKLRDAGIEDEQLQDGYGTLQGDASVLLSLASVLIDFQTGFEILPGTVQ